MRLPKQCTYCNKLIPANRKSSARYCSDACYYEAKKERSAKQYNSKQVFINRFREYEQILANFYPLYLKGQVITYDVLDQLQFDWGIANGELQDSKLCVWKVIGKYCYLINTDKTISIELCNNSNK
ncbi:MAG: hypothetical protein JST70_13020 [Bacteroidetes bacterium]|nr:hypothetical protein [Bacteroidota bacterium]